MTFIHSKLLFTGKIDNGVVTISNPAGREVLLVSRNPVIGNPWTSDEQNIYMERELTSRNKLVLDTAINSKLSDISRIYDLMVTSNVTLSDGNIFSPSKVSGSTISNLQNTVDLIKSAVEYALYVGDTEIILSDANNHDVTYEIDRGDALPMYILPVVGIGKYLNDSFITKRSVRNVLLTYLTLDTIDIDEIDNLDIEALMKDKMTDITTP